MLFEWNDRTFFGVSANIYSLHVDITSKQLKNNFLVEELIREISTFFLLQICVVPEKKLLTNVIRGRGNMKNKTTAQSHLISTFYDIFHRLLHYLCLQLKSLG